MKNIATAQIFTSRGQQEFRASIPNSKNLRSYMKSHEEQDNRRERAVEKR
jgi:hypothetical protein